MTSSFRARITVDAGEKNKAIFESVSADNRFYPENPTKTVISLNDKMLVEVSSAQLSHLRASLNAFLRLILASYYSIEAAEPCRDTA